MTTREQHREQHHLWKARQLAALFHTRHALVTKLPAWDELPTPEQNAWKDLAAFLDGLMDERLTRTAQRSSRRRAALRQMNRSITLMNEEVDRQIAFRLRMKLQLEENQRLLAWLRAQCEAKDEKLREYERRELG